MNNKEQVSFFLQMFEEWTSAKYSIDIRYVAGGSGEESSLWDAAIHLMPLPPEKDHSFHLDVGSFSVGQIQKKNAKKSFLHKVLTDAVNGEISAYGRRFNLEKESQLDYFSNIYQRNAWLSRAHLQVLGRQRRPPSALELVAVDDALRSATPPFDGFEDVSSWLGLRAPAVGTVPPSINITIAPPIEIAVPEMKLSENQLSMKLIAHAQFDTAKIGLAIRAAPGRGLHTRMQMAHQIHWSKAKKGLKNGILNCNLEEADAVQALLMVGGSTVQRQWIQDKSKARNLRLLAAQLFDKDLRMIRRYLLDPDFYKDSAKFENAIASLFFLLGFTPAVQLETDAPDLIVTTPSGHLILVECTTRISDISSKIGKLVDRRESLAKSLSQGGHAEKVSAMLVCASEKSNIPLGIVDARSLNIALLAREAIVAALDQVPFPTEPSERLETLLKNNDALSDALKS